MGLWVEASRDWAQRVRPDVTGLSGLPPKHPWHEEALRAALAKKVPSRIEAIFFDGMDMAAELLCGV